MNFAPRYLVNNFTLFKHSNKQVITYMLKAMLPCSWMHDGAYVHDLQMLNACVTPGCYNSQSIR
jgi:hypothetical protein